MGCFNIFAAASQSRDEQLKRMTEAPIGPLIISLAIPTILSMLTTALYNTADTYFVSQLGTSASGAVGVVFCLMAIFQATGFTLGMGAGSVISRRLGGGDAASASAYGSASFFSALTLGTCICVLGQIFIDPLMVLLGSTPTILPYARAYARWILLGAPVMCCCFVMNNILRAEGHSAFAMCGLVTGGLLNIVLDPIFIFTFGLGISGAAAATLLSQCVSFTILASFFLRGKSMVGISVKNLPRRAATYCEIVRLGFPSLSRQGLASISTAALNASAGAYGDAAVAAMSIVGRIFMFILSVMIGLGQGFTPVVGFNYGSRRYSRVREAFWFTVKAGMALMTALTLAGWIFAPEIIALFRAGGHSDRDARDALPVRGADASAALRRDEHDAPGLGLRVARDLPRMHAAGHLLPPAHNRAAAHVRHDRRRNYADRLGRLQLRDEPAVLILFSAKTERPGKIREVTLNGRF